jgi:carnosine N-methyltransferase
MAHMVTEDDVTASTSSASDHAESSSTAGPPSDQPQHSLSSAYQTVMRMDSEEQAHWADVCRAYRQYAAFAAKQFGLNHPYRIAKLPPEQQAVLPARLQHGTAEFTNRLQLFKEAAIRNQFCLDCILRHAGQPHSQQPPQQSSSSGEEEKFATSEQLSKVSSVLKSLARDWSIEGKAERDMAYLPILQSVQTYLPMRPNGRVHKICVPGAGVMRLGCELAALGYTVQGNEFSLYMLLASDFILNGPLVSVAEAKNTGKLPLTISPWLLETRNVYASTDPLRAVQIPDEDPFEMIASKHAQSPSTDQALSRDENGVQPKAAHAREANGDTAPTAPPDSSTHGADFSMAAGDFASVYGVATEECAWDCVVACFFLDASPSIIEYLQVIHRMLKPGGVLISFGPLHWHWSGPAMLLSDDSSDDYEKRNSYLDEKVSKLTLEHNAGALGRRKSLLTAAFVPY